MYVLRSSTLMPESGPPFASAPMADCSGLVAVRGSLAMMRSESDASRRRETARLHILRRNSFFLEASRDGRDGEPGEPPCTVVAAPRREPRREEQVVAPPQA